jgi:hypothetical protein
MGTRDTAQKHSGAASLKLTTNTSANPVQATMQSTCVNASFAAGLVPVGYWYRATAGISGVAMTVNAYANTGCGAGVVQTSFQPGVLDTTGTWQRVSANLNLPSAAQSFKITLANGCNAGCNTARTSNFDDIAVGEAPPTAVTLVSFRGTRTTQGVRLVWKTAAASHLAGFNVYRGQTKVNRTLIASTRGVAGAYAWVDRTIGRSAHGITYRLQAVSLDGTRTWLGSARVS